MSETMTVDVHRCEQCGETMPTPTMAWDHVLRNGHAPIVTPYREAVYVDPTSLNSSKGADLA